MKLRNKKTGEIVVGINKIGLVWNKFGMPAEIGQYDSIVELNAEWEDYKPAEPLIKDEKIRKAVRAWAELNKSKQVVYVEYTASTDYCCLADMDNGYYCIKFVGRISALKDGEEYTIDEICGDDDA